MKKSQETLEKVLMLYMTSKKSKIQIAKECNVSDSYVGKVLNAFHLKKLCTDYPQDTLDSAVNLYIDGERIDDILEATGITRAILYRELDERQIERRLEKSFKNQPKKVCEELVYEMYQKNMSISQIAKELEVSVNTINRIITEGLESEEMQISDKDLEDKLQNEICIKLAPVIVMQQKNCEISIRDVAKAFGVKERKLYYRVAEAKKEMTDK